jgi:opacity protein-like surface antigen
MRHLRAAVTLHRGLAPQVLAAVATLVLVPTLARAQAHGSAQGFGGLSLGVTNTAAPNVGGNVTLAVTPNVHVIGEVGRLGNVLPTLADAVFAVPGITASAVYGEGGVRILSGAGAVRPYAEATAGMARLQIGTTRFGSVGNAIAAVGSSFLDRTGPVAGVGGGVVTHVGPVVFDVGYRYKRLFPPDTLGLVLGLGQDLRSQQVRVGVGFRF